MNTNDKLYAIKNDISTETLQLLDELSDKLIDTTPVPEPDAEKEQSFYEW